MEITKKGILNTVAATGTNVLIDSTVNKIYVASNVISQGSGGSYAPTSPASIPQLLTDNVINQGDIKSISVLASQAEVSQGVVVGINPVDGSQEVVIANTPYKINAEIFGETYEDYNKQPRIYSVTSPLNLTGSADLDRANIFGILANQINNHYDNYLVASLLSRVPFTLGSSTTGATGLSNASGTNLVIAGSNGLQDTSLATANIAYLQITSGTIAGGTAAGFAYIYNVSSTWSDTSYVTTFTDAVTAENITITTEALPAIGQGLYLQDVAGYFQPANQTNSMRPFLLSRYGASLIQAPASLQGAGLVKIGTTVGSTTTTKVTDVVPSWVTTPIVVRTAVYSRGIGSVLAKTDPRFYYTGEELISGNGYQIIAFGGSIDATKTYSLVTIRTASQIVEGLSNTAGVKHLDYVILVDESNPTQSNPSNLTNFITALNAVRVL